MYFLRHILLPALLLSVFSSCAMQQQRALFKPLRYPTIAFQKLKESIQIIKDNPKTSAGMLKITACSAIIAAEVLNIFTSTFNEGDFSLSQSALAVAVASYLPYLAEEHAQWRTQDGITCSIAHRDVSAIIQFLKKETSCETLSKFIHTYRMSIKNMVHAHTDLPPLNNESSALLLSLVDEPSFAQYILTHYPDADKKIAFQNCLEKNYFKMADFLKKYGAPINFKNQYGITSLMKYCITQHSKNNQEKLLWLLHNGAEVNAQNNIGKTALHYACHAEDLDAIKLLLQHGADATQRDSHAYTPLHLALVDRNNLQIMQLLIDHDADCNAPLYEERGSSTPLHIACCNPIPNKTCIAYLLYSGADKKIETSDGETVLDITRQRITTSTSSKEKDALLELQELLQTNKKITIPEEARTLYLKQVQDKNNTKNILTQLQYRQLNPSSVKKLKF